MNLLSEIDYKILKIINKEKTISPQKLEEIYSSNDLSKKDIRISMQLLISKGFIGINDNLNLYVNQDKHLEYYKFSLLDYINENLDNIENFPNMHGTPLLIENKYLNQLEFYYIINNQINYDNNNLIHDL